jgi:hypothetical protein
MGGFKNIKMIKLTVDEAYAFDYYSILSLKYKNGFLSEEILQTAKNDLEDSLGIDLVENILNSPEYASLLDANQLTFNAVDKAKEDLVKASYVDKCNYERMLAKKALQNKFFNSNLSEVKIGYEKHK